MLVSEILKSKGDRVYQITPAATLAEVIDRLVDYKCGALMVTEYGDIKGIITERDILRTIASARGPLSSIYVRDTMTTDLVTGTPMDELTLVMSLMTNHRIRHLPILDQNRLAGIISIGDVVKAQLASLALENHYLKSYIQS
jgi:CBS domain-containing protein